MKGIERRRRVRFFGTSNVGSEHCSEQVASNSIAFGRWISDLSRRWRWAPIKLSDPWRRKRWGQPKWQFRRRHLRHAESEMNVSVDIDIGEHIVFFNDCDRIDLSGVDGRLQPCG